MPWAKLASTLLVAVTNCFLPYYFYINLLFYEALKLVREHA